MSKELPVILAVDDAPDAASALERDLPRRYAADYRVIVECSPEAGLQQLRRLREESVDVALVIAGFHLHGMSGIDLLVDAHDLHPDARRVLMIVYGEAATSDNEIAHARALGQIDCYITKPWASPEEWLYITLTELLSEWAQTHLPTFEVVRVVGPRWSPEAHHLRDLLARNPVPHGYYADDSEVGRELLERHNLGPVQLPAAFFADGRVLSRPSDAEIAAALGARTTSPAGLYDVAVIGAGPAGLAAAVYGASEGLRTVVLEKEAVGGQAGTSSMIRNYLGFPRGISGAALALRAFQQSTMFGAGNSAGQAVIHLARYASQVTMLVRGDSLGNSMSEYLIQEIADKPNIDVRFQSQVVGARGGSSLAALQIQDSGTGEIRTEPADALFILIGAEPRTDWLPEEIERDERGYILTGHDLALDCGCEGHLPGIWPLEREPYLLETSVPGVFAAGDVRYRSMKRVASAVGEGSTAISLIHQHLAAGFEAENASRRGPAHVCERHRLISGRRHSHD